MKMANVTFTGNIGKYHGLKFGQDGKAYAKFSAAETAREKNPQSGQWEDGATTWFNVTVFGHNAEALDSAVTDGKGKVLVTGRMKTRKFEHNGEQRESLDVAAEAVAIIPRSQQNNRQDSSGFAPAQAQKDPWAAPQPAFGNNPPF